MTKAELSPAAMARIYAECFAQSRPWTAEEIMDLAKPPGFLVASDVGFALGRTVAGEAELLTLVVAPFARRQGTGRALLAAFEARACEAASCAFLEVAADNAGARALYSGEGWRETGRRPGYYARRTGPDIDAILMAKDLR